MLTDAAPELRVGETQADEIYVGGKEKNKHASKHKEHTQGRSTETKVPVVGLYNKGNVRTFVVESVNKETLKGIIETTVEKTSMVATDGLNSYLFLDKGYEHVIVNHTEGEYVKDGFYTNGMENFWSLPSRGIIGIYHSVSPQHLHRYCNEFAARYNQRKDSNIDRFVQVIEDSDKDRVRYRILTANGKPRSKKSTPQA